MKLASDPPAIACAPWLDRLRQAIALAVTGKDPEGVHQLRVAASRLSVWLRLGGRRLLVDDLRWLRRAARDVRDHDVLIACGGPESYLSQLVDELAAARRVLLAALASTRLRGLLEALRVSPHVAQAPAAAVLRMWQRQLRARGDAFDWHGAQADALHDLRRQLRRVRYAREWLERGDPRLKAGAELLGVCNDFAVRCQRLRHMGMPTDDADLRHRAERARATELWPLVRNALVEDG